MKICLLGATGYIGSYLKKYLIDKYELSYPTKQECDLLTDECSNYFRDKIFDIIIYSVNGKENLKMYNNFVRNIRLKSNGKVLYFGSGAEIGRKFWKKDMYEEQSSEKIPDDSYGLSKYIINKLIKYTGNGKIINLRLFATYGTGRDIKTFLPDIIKQCRNNKKIVIENNNHYDYLYLSDLCRIVEYFIINIDFIHYDNYNICTGKTISNKEITEIIMKLLKIDKKIDILNENGVYYSGNNLRLESFMLHQYKITPFETGLKEIINYY